MTTSLNSASTARDAGYQLVSFLRKTVSFDSPGIATAVTIGVLPAGAIVTGGGVAVTTAFTGASATNTIDVGYALDALASANATAYATALIVGTLGVQALDELATATNVPARSAPTTVVARFNGSAATAGSAEVIVEYILPR